MLFSKKTVEEKRCDLKQDLQSGRLLQFPGSFSPFISLLIEQLGFDGIYISGAVIANDLALPDIGLTTLTEVTQRSRAISRVTALPAFVDIDTGFGQPMNVARTIQEMEEAGLCGCHLEDQMNPKRCGHLDHKALIDTASMVQKIKAACNARRDDNFLLIARTDSRSVEGLDKAIDRAKAYVDGGAEMIFPESLHDIKEFELFRQAVKVPLLANMTEFGKSPLLSAKELEGMGYNIVIYPVTGFRLAMKAVEDGLADIKQHGSQKHLLDKMQPRQRLYEILRYEDYNQFDQSIYNFDI